MQLHRARAQFEESGGHLVLIGQATPRQAAHFRRRQGIQLPVLADEDEPPARVAHEVVVVLAARMSPLEPGQPVTYRYALDQSVLDKQVEHPVNARAAGGFPAARSASSISTALSAHGSRAKRSMIRRRAPPCLSPARPNTSSTCSVHAFISRDSLAAAPAKQE